MPAINFKKQFAKLVKTGQKRQTIRPLRKYPIKPGDKLYLYTGLRTKQCKKIKEAECFGTWPIIIKVGRIIFDGRDLGMLGMADIIKRDGFQQSKDFFNFFEKQYGLPFMGRLIRW